MPLLSAVAMNAAALAKPIDQHVKKGGLRNLCVQRLPPRQAALGIDANFGCGFAFLFMASPLNLAFLRFFCIRSRTAAARCSRYALPLAGVLPTF